MIVRIHDTYTDEWWSGEPRDGLIHDASGVLDPHDIGFRFAIYTLDGEDVTEQYI